MTIEIFWIYQKHWLGHWIPDLDSKVKDLIDLDLDLWREDLDLDSDCEDLTTSLAVRHLEFGKISIFRHVTYICMWFVISIPNLTLIDQ